MIVESLIGSAIGGLMRLAPEVLKVFDRKNERSHELAMLDKEMEFAKVRGEVEMRKVDQQLDIAELEAVTEALKGQASMAAAGGKFVSAAAALVRPLVTYWFVFMYSATKMANFWLAYRVNTDWAEVTVAMWGEQDWGILSLLLTFWFVGRIYERKEPRVA